MVGRYGYISVLFILAVCTIASGSTASATNFVCTKVPYNNTAVKVCVSGTSNAGAKIRAIHAAFGRSNITDVVFLIDRSKSMSDELFKSTKSSITTLMNYLMLRRLVYLHPDYTRVSVVSFGSQSMVEFDGIKSNSGSVNSCNFEVKLANINLGRAKRDDTNMSAALSVAEKMFGSSSRNGANKILWVFTDGESDCSSARKLHRQGVTVFSAGVGDWMAVPKRENAVMYFAKDTYHYACAKDWTSIIQTATNKVDVGARDNEPALYVADDTTYGKCLPCPRPQRCVCNVLDRSYTCANIRPTHSTPEDVTLSQTTHEAEDTTPSHTTPEDVTPIPKAPILLTLVIIAVICAAVVFLIVCCVCCCRRCKSCKRAPPVAPRIPPRNGTQGEEWSTGFDGNKTELYYNSGMSTPDAVVRQESWLNDQVACEPGGDVPRNQQNLPYEQPLMGPDKWKRRVLAEADTHGLKGLCIYDIKTNCAWAATNCFIVLTAEIEKLKQVLHPGDVGSCIKYISVARKTYAIDRTELSIFHATNKKNGDHLWVAILQGSFVIVGVAAKNKSEDCENVVVDLMRQLPESIA